MAQPMAKTEQVKVWVMHGSTGDMGVHVLSSGSRSKEIFDTENVGREILLSADGVCRLANLLGCSTERLPNLIKTYLEDPELHDLADVMDILDGYEVSYVYRVHAGEYTALRSN